MSDEIFAAGSAPELNDREKKFAAQTEVYAKQLAVSISQVTEAYFYMRYHRLNTIDAFLMIIHKIEELNKQMKKAAIGGSTAGAFGSALIIGGTVAAPFTGGASLLAVGIGGALTSGGGAANLISGGVTEGKIQGEKDGIDNFVKHDRGRCQSFIAAFREMTQLYEKMGKDAAQHTDNAHGMRQLAMCAAMVTYKMGSLGLSVLKINTAVSALCKFGAGSMGKGGMSAFQHMANSANTGLSGKVMGACIKPMGYTALPQVFGKMMTGAGVGFAAYGLVMESKNIADKLDSLMKSDPHKATEMLREDRESLIKELDGASEAMENFLPIFDIVAVSTGAYLVADGNEKVKLHPTLRSPDYTAQRGAVANSRRAMPGDRVIGCANPTNVCEVLQVDGDGDFRVRTPMGHAQEQYKYAKDFWYEDPPTGEGCNSSELQIGDHVVATEDMPPHCFTGQTLKVKARSSVGDRDVELYNVSGVPINEGLARTSFRHPARADKCPDPKGKFLIRPSKKDSNLFFIESCSYNAEGCMLSYGPDHEVYFSKGADYMCPNTWIIDEDPRTGALTIMGQLPTRRGPYLSHDTRTTVDLWTSGGDNQHFRIRGFSSMPQDAAAGAEKVNALDVKEAQIKNQQMGWFKGGDIFVSPTTFPQFALRYFPTGNGPAGLKTRGLWHLGVDNKMVREANDWHFICGGPCQALEESGETWYDVYEPRISGNAGKEFVAVGVWVCPRKKSEKPREPEAGGCVMVHKSVTCIGAASKEVGTIVHMKPDGRDKGKPLEMYDLSVHLDTGGFCITQTAPFGQFPFTPSPRDVYTIRKPMVQERKVIELMAETQGR